MTFRFPICFQNDYAKDDLAALLSYFTLRVYFSSLDRLCLALTMALSLCQAVMGRGHRAVYHYSPYSPKKHAMTMCSLGLAGPLEGHPIYGSQFPLVFLVCSRGQQPSVIGDSSRILSAQAHAQCHAQALLIWSRSSGTLLRGRLCLNH